MIDVNAIDIPQAWDEWAWMYDGLGRSFDWLWAWRQHNEYRLVLSKLLVWLLYRFDGWNQVTALRVSYALFFAIPALILVMAWRDSRSSMWALVPFLIFFFSNASVESDVTGAMSLVKFLLIFLLLGVLFLFDEKQRWPALLAGSLCLAMTTLSSGGGIPGSLGIIAVFGAYKVSRIRAGRPILPELGGLALPVLSLGAASALWLFAWIRWVNNIQGGLEDPTDVTGPFWIGFFNQVAMAVGRDALPSPQMYSHIPLARSHASTLIGAGIVVLLLVLLRLDWSKQRANPDSGTWRRIGLAGAILSVQASISLGRSSDAAGWSRYFEYALLLLPILVLSGYSILQGNLRRIYLASLFVVCLAGYFPHWSDEPYREQGALRRSGVECMQRTLREGTKNGCMGMGYNFMLRGILRAKELDISFYRSHFANLPLPKCVPYVIDTNEPCTPAAGGPIRRQ